MKKIFPAAYILFLLTPVIHGAGWGTTLQHHALYFSAAQVLDFCAPQPTASWKKLTKGIVIGGAAQLLATVTGVNLPWKEKAFRHDLVSSILASAIGAGISEIIPEPQETNVSKRFVYTFLHMATVWGISQYIYKTLTVQNPDCALFYFVRNNNRAGVRAALARGADINKKFEPGQNTLLHLMIGENRRESIQLLLEQEGLDINAENADGITPLYAAVDWHDDKNAQEIVKLLLQERPRAQHQIMLEEEESTFEHTPSKSKRVLNKAWNNNKYLTLLQLLQSPFLVDGERIKKKYAFESAECEVMEVLQHLSSLYINAREEISGQTLLHKALWGKNIAAVKHLLQIPHVDVNATDQFGVTPLIQVTADHNLICHKTDLESLKDIKQGSECIKLLLKGGAHIDQDTLHCSAYMHDETVMLLFMQHGVDPASGRPNAYDKARENTSRDATEFINKMREARKEYVRKAFISGYKETTLATNNAPLADIILDCY